MSLWTLLRRVDPLAQRRAEFVRRVSASGHGIGSSVPGAGGHYLSFAAYQADGEQWRAVMDMRAWLAKALPGLEALLPEGCSQADILQLFAAAQPVTVEVECLAYEQITEVSAVRDLSLLGQPLPVIETPQGTLWVTHPPSTHHPLHTMVPAWAHVLPMPLSWVIGYSALPSARLARLACGDVLQICDCRWEVRVCRQVIGGFTLIDEGLFMSINAEQPMHIADEAQPEDPVVADWPVQLQFVLHESTLSLSGLNALTEGHVMPLGEHTVRQVQIKVNGQAVAEGELVRWEDRLGVELHTVYRGEA